MWEKKVKDEYILISWIVWGQVWLLFLEEPDMLNVFEV